MKWICTGFFILIASLSRGQSDTQTIDLKHLSLDEVLVLDNWENKHALKKTAENHQLELQLKQLKGVNLISRGSFAQELIYRGQADGRIQVKLNGMRVYHACTDRMDPSTSYIVANNLSSAELASSCESQCSSNGLAGSINLKTKEASFQKSKTWRFGFNQQYQTNTHGLNSAFFVESNSEKLAWRLNGTWLKNANYRDGRGQEVLYSQNEKQNWALNSVYRLSPKQFLKLDFIFDLATNVGYPALPMDVGLARAFIGGLSYHSYHPLGPFANFELKLYHNDIYHEMDDTQREEVFMHMDMPGWSRTSGISLEAMNWKTGAHRINLFTEYYSNFRRAEMTMFPSNSSESAMFMLSWPDTRLNGMALGISDHWHFAKNSVQSTIRFDYESSSILSEIGKDQWTGMGYTLKSPRNFLLAQIKTAYRHQLNSKISLNSAISIGSRGPTTSELYGFYLFNAHDNYDYLGNPELEAEQLLSLEIGQSYRSEKLQFSTSLFSQFYRNYIFGINTNYDAMTFGAKGLREYQNLAHATFWGSELAGEYAFNKKLGSRVKLDYLRGIHPDFDLPLIPPLQALVALNYRYQNFRYLIQSRMAAEQKHFNTAYGDRYTPAYMLWDAGIEYQLDMEKYQATFSLNANNLFNQYYRDHLNWGAFPSMGRNLILSLTLKF